MAQTVIENIKGKPHVIGVYDCNLMMLDHAGFDITKIEPFSSGLQGRRNIKKATGCKNYDEFLIKHGFSKINPMFVSDGCILRRGVHFFIFNNGYLFGLHPNKKVFDFFKIDYKHYDNFEVYQKWA